ncbi:hypothetical protein [Hymenobacter bucti]|uniref:Uncharacterized protein n=1 Tax=Hymenobacter bucti TaxID=1844114 RepID=A0ABW4QZ28_9BACT
MSWLMRLRAWWRGSPAPPPRAFTDPLDYALHYCLHPPPGGPAALPGTCQAAFPTLTKTEAEVVQQHLLALQELAADLGSRVNRQLLAGPAAYDCLWAAYPQLDRGNLGTLLWQAFVGTR